MSETKDRITWIDSAKGILIVIVILGHSLAETSFESPFYHGYILSFRLITLFHMPAFFIISGLLMNNKKGWKVLSPWLYIKRKLSKLVLPYFIFEGIAIILLVFILRFKTFKNALIDTLILKCNLGADWFLVTMFFSSCLFFFIIRLTDSKCMLVITILVSIAIASFCNRESHLQLLLARCLIALCFMAIGYLFEGYKEYISMINMPLYLTFIALFILAFAVLNGPVSMYDIMMGKSKLVFVLGAILGTLLVMCMSQRLATNMFSIIGKNSLVIMGVHQHIVYVTRGLGLKIYGFILTMALFCIMFVYSLIIVGCYNYIHNKIFLKIIPG